MSLKVGLLMQDYGQGTKNGRAIHIQGAERVVSGIDEWYRRWRVKHNKASVPDHVRSKIEYWYYKRENSTFSAKNERALFARRILK